MSKISFPRPKPLVWNLELVSIHEHSRIIGDSILFGFYASTHYLCLRLLNEMPYLRY